MKPRTVSFEEIQEAHRKERAADAADLKSGRVTAQELQERNSIIPAGVPIQIEDLAGYLKKRRRAK